MKLVIFPLPEREHSHSPLSYERKAELSSQFAREKYVGLGEVGNIPTARARDIAVGGEVAQSLGGWNTRNMWTLLVLHLCTPSPAAEGRLSRFRLRATQRTRRLFFEWAFEGLVYCMLSPPRI